MKTPRSTSKILQQTKIDVTVTLTENKSHKKVGQSIDSVANQFSSEENPLSEREVVQRAREILDSIHSKRGGLLASSQSEIGFKGVTSVLLRKKNAQTTVNLGGGTSRNREENQKNAETVRSMSNKFLAQEQRNKVKDILFSQTSSLPQLSSRLQDYQIKQLNGILTVEKNEKNETNPFKKAIQYGNSIEQGRSLSTQTLKSKTAKFQKYLPNIQNDYDLNEKSLINVNKEANRLKIVLKKDSKSKANLEVQPINDYVRQDVSYLNEAHTPQQKATILTTGDRGQDELLEATMGFKNLGKSLIHLPQTVEDLKAFMRGLQKGSSNIFCGNIQNPDEDERAIDRYLLESFSPLEAIQMLYQEGKIDRQTLMKIKLPNLQLRQYTKKSPQNKKNFLHKHAISVQDKSPSSFNQLQIFNAQDRLKKPSEIYPGAVSPFELKYDGNTQVTPQLDELQLINDKLAQKYGDKAFLNIESKNKGVRHSIDRQTKLPPVCNESINLFGEPVIIQPDNQSKYQAPQDLGNPSSRQDAIILVQWFEKSLENIIQAEEQEGDNLYPLLQLIMNICIQELVRQVSVHCLERGQLLKRVFSSYIRFIDLVNIDHIKKRKNLKLDYAYKLDRYITILESQAEGYRDQIGELENQNRLMKAEQEELYKQIKEYNGILLKYKKKCLIQQRDAEANNVKLRFLEKENKHLKLKMKDIKDDYNLDISDLDENDKLRLMLDVEREIQELERERVLHQSKFTRTTNSFIDDTEILQVADKDIIAQDERATGTEDLEDYWKLMLKQKTRDRGNQTEVSAQNTDVQVDNYQLGLMENQETDTDDLTRNKDQSPRNKLLSVIIEDGEEVHIQDSDKEGSEDDSSDDDSFDINGSVTQKRGNTPIDLKSLQAIQNTRSVPGVKGFQSRNSVALPNTSSSLSNNQVGNDSPAQQSTQLINFLALTLVKRADQILNKEKDRILKLADVSPSFLSQQLKKSIDETTQDVEKVKVEIFKKQKQLRKSLRKSKKTETNLKQANDKIDILEMDNYNLREQLQESVKMLEDCNSLINEMQTTLNPQYDSVSGKPLQRIKDIVTQLNDIFASSQERAMQLVNLEDHDNSTNIVEIPKEINIAVDEQTSQNHLTALAQSNNTPGRSSKTISNQDFNRKRANRLQYLTTGKRMVSQSKTKGTHPAYVHLKKIQAKDPKKLKDIMPRKLLLRVISQVYQERGIFEINSSEGNALNSYQQQQQQSQLLQSVSSTQYLAGQTVSSVQQNSAFQTTNQQNQQNSLIEWIYDTFMQKYGLKNVAERKFIQLISSCIAYKDQLPKITLFGRFLEVYDDLPISEYNRYLNLISYFTSQILNFKIDENSDLTLLPLNRTIDYFKSKFESKMVSHQITHQIHLIQKIKAPVTSEDLKGQKHLKGVHEGVDFDWFAQFIIDSYIFIQEDKEAQIKDLFSAIDVIFIILKIKIGYNYRVYEFIRL